ncbi:MAG: class I SAM-dependent RNA methyltransferase [Oscillospiraceae bacterium]|jgi:putative N6-adenine-specific DNA methylase|nr:class I SAM-dependent RNA methyltransferase [Oscillospiraceae bacterium]
MTDTIYTYAVPCLFGVEGLAADELKRMNMQNVRAENGRVLFDGPAADLARANVNLATGERVTILAGEGAADTFDMLFELVRAIPWERYLPKNASFPVTGHALSSKLHSVPDCQKIIKKAISKRLTEVYKVERHPEDGAEYKVRFTILNDNAALSIDTTGAGLHKRGYRPAALRDGVATVAAPLSETLAAAMVRVARFRGREALRDPFCGSGTIAIEAALAALNRAPGCNRKFTAQTWTNLPQSVWQAAREEAKAKEFHGDYDIWGGDIDPACVEVANENARRAGVSQNVRFEVADARSFAPNAPSGVVITNPPYGERVMERSEAERLYREFGAATKELRDWKIYLLSSHTEFERNFGRTANKKRKLYNGMIKCDLFMYN